MLMKEVLSHHLSSLVLSKSRGEQHQEGTTRNHPKKKGDVGEFRMRVQSLVRELRSHMLQRNYAVLPQPERSPQAAVKDPRPHVPQLRPNTAKNK